MPAKAVAKNFQERLKSLGFSGYTLILIVILIFGVATLSHTISVYVAQQQEIKAMRASLKNAQDLVQAQTNNIENWQDPAYIKAQARDRLFYVMPGELQLGVINDIEIPRTRTEITEAELTKAQENWLKNLVASALLAGLADPPQPSETPADSETPAESTQ